MQRNKLTSVLTALALTGATTGTLLDGIHSRVQVLIYDSMPLQIGGLQTSMWVPILLAGFYAVVGGLVLWTDYRLASGGDGPTLASLRWASLSKTAISFGALTAMLELSSVLYASHHPSELIAVILAALASINYLAFDGTKQGLALAALCAFGAPAIELLLMNPLHLWHYPLGDLWAMSGEGSGIPRWVPLCYFM
jgi:endoplasmic reticulum chaperone BiP